MDAGADVPSPRAAAAPPAQDIGPAAALLAFTTLAFSTRRTASHEGGDRAGAPPRTASAGAPPRTAGRARPRPPLLHGFARDGLRDLGVGLGGGVRDGLRDGLRDLGGGLGGGVRDGLCVLGVCLVLAAAVPVLLAAALPR